MFIGDTMELSEEGKKEFKGLSSELQEVWEANREFLEDMRNSRDVGIRSSQIGALLVMAVRARVEAYLECDTCSSRTMDISKDGETCCTIIEGSEGCIGKLTLNRW